MPVTRLQPAPAEQPTRRERQRLETRNRIYEAALEEFTSAGYGAAQIDRIVEKAGVARGTFYFHFPTKEHVLMEQQRRIERAIVARLADLSGERPASVKEFLLGLTRAIVAGAESIGDRALGRDLMAIYVREPRVVDASANPLVVAIVDYFAEAAERGEVRTDLPPEEIANIFLTSLFGFVATSIDALEERLEEFGRIIDVFVRGVSA